MTRELRVSARRVARPGTASCADAPGESRDAARTVDLATRQAELVAALVAGGPLPSGFDPDRLATAPAVMLERDGRYPPAAQLHAELDAIAAAAALPRVTA